MQLFQAKPFLILSLVLCVFRHVEGSATAIGCFKDKASDRALPELLHNYRGGMDWTNLINVVIKKCQLEAKEKGYKCFGIQYYGECWSGEDACDDFSKHGISEECFCSGNKYKRYTPGTFCRGAVGGPYANFVYELE